MEILRRLRGVLVTAVTWGAAFAALSTILGSLAVVGIAVSGTPVPSDIPGGIAAAVVAGIARWATIGALSGAVFATSIMVAERRQTLASLSARRFARWGLLAGALGSTTVVIAFVALLPVGFVAASGWSLAAMMSGVPVVGGALGHAAATATLKAARRDVALADVHEKTAASQVPDGTS